MQQSRKATSQYAIILFCVLGIATLNAYAHNGFRVDFEAMRQTVMKAFGMGGVRKGYEYMTLWEFLNRHAADPKAMEALKGVAIEGQILKEKALDPEDPNFNQAEKVGTTFKLSRIFSETGGEEGAHVISVEVNYPRPEGLEANMWVLVQGQVRTIEAGPDKGKPVIDAVAVTKLRSKPENVILTPQGELSGPGADADHDHSNCGHEH